MSDKTVLIEDVLGDFGFRVKWTYESHWADVEVYEIVARSEGDVRGVFDVPHFNRAGYMSSDDQVEEIHGAEKYINGFIKWDGCAELDQGNPHWCGVECFKKHCALLEYLWKRSGELLSGREMMDFAPWEAAHPQTVLAREAPAD